MYGGAIEYPQREILAVIEAAGLIPSNDDLTQLKQAIQFLVNSGKIQPGAANTWLHTNVEGVIEWKPLAAQDKYDLCEFYYFRHPTLKPGFLAAQGGLIANADTLYPDAWAYLQTTQGKLLCKTEVQWQALTTATWATLADGTTVGWNGIGGAPFYVVDTAAKTLRLPDLRGMYAEAAGFDSLGVGDVHGDGIRDIDGSVTSYATGDSRAKGLVDADGVFLLEGANSPGFNVGPSSGTKAKPTARFSSNRVVPTANKNQPRAWGALACVYLGMPR